MYFLVFFQMPLSGAHVCLYADGTSVTEEFFTTLCDNTELVLLSREQTWDGGWWSDFKTNTSTPHLFVSSTDQTFCRFTASVTLLLFSNPYNAICLRMTPAVCDIGLLLGTDQHTTGLIKAAKGLLFEENSPKRRKILADLLQNLEDRSELESRDEDEDWFKGKESFYLVKTHDDQMWIEHVGHTFVSVFFHWPDQILYQRCKFKITGTIQRSVWQLIDHWMHMSVSLTRLNYSWACC